MEEINTPASATPLGFFNKASKIVCQNIVKMALSKPGRAVGRGAVSVLEGLVDFVASGAALTTAQAALFVVITTIGAAAVMPRTMMSVTSSGMMSVLETPAAVGVGVASLLGRESGVAAMSAYLSKNDTMEQHLYFLDKKSEKGSKVASDELSAIAVGDVFLSDKPEDHKSGMEMLLRLVERGHVRSTMLAFSIQSGCNQETPTIPVACDVLKKAFPVPTK